MPDGFAAISIGFSASPSPAIPDRAPNRHTDHSFVFGAFSPVLLAGDCRAAPTLEARQTRATGTVRGVVLDAATGAPLSRVLVARPGRAAPRRSPAATGRSSLPCSAGGASAARVGRGLFRRRARGDCRARELSSTSRSPWPGAPGYSGVRDRQRRSVPVGRPGRAGPAGARQRRHPEPARRPGRRSAAGRPGAARRRDRRRPAQRVQRPRQQLLAHAPDARRLHHALPAARHPRRRGRVELRLGRDDQQRHPPGRRARQRRLRAAIGQPHGRVGRVQRALGIARADRSCAPRSAARASSVVVEGPLGGEARFVAGVGAPELSRPGHRPAGRRPGAVRVLGRAGQGRLRPQPVAARCS